MASRSLGARYPARRSCCSPHGSRCRGGPCRSLRLRSGRSQLMLAPAGASLLTLETPRLILDLDRLEKNCAAMRARCDALGVALRPHLKTAKSVDVARIATGGTGGITVSTL